MESECVYVCVERKKERELTQISSVGKQNKKQTDQERDRDRPRDREKKRERKKKGEGERERDQPLR